MRAAPHFLYGQDLGFRDLYVGASFGPHQQGFRLVPQQHTAQADLDLAKAQLHDHLLSYPRFKCVLHAAPEVFAIRGQAACVTASSIGTVKSYSELLVREPHDRCRTRTFESGCAPAICTNNAGEQIGAMPQGMRTFAELKGLGVGVGPAGEPK